MDYESLLHIICVSGIVLCAITLICYILLKKCSILQKINAGVYFVFLGIYFYVTEIMLNFVRNYYLSNLDYNSIILSVITLACILGVLLVFIGLFYKNAKFQKYSYRVFEGFMLILSVALIINVATSVTNSVFLAPLIFLTLIFSEHFMINATETLDTAASKIFYFVVNVIIGCIWIVGMIALAIKLSFNANAVFIMLSISALIIALSSIIFGILRIKKGELKKEN